MRYPSSLRLLAFWAAGLTLTAPADALDPQKLISQFTHTAWSAKDGIAPPVNAIAQSHDGYLWLGTPAGLFRFDGLHFVLWEPRFGEHLPTYSISSLYVGRDETLWIGFSSGGIGRLAAGHLTIWLPSDGVPSGGVSSITEDPEGVIWAGGEYGLSRFDKGNWQRVGTESGYPAPGAQQLLVDRPGNLWVETDGWNAGSGKNPVLRNGLLTLAPKAKTFVNTGLVVGYRFGMARGPDGAIWILSGRDNIPRQVSSALGRVEGFGIGAGFASPVLIDRDNSLWVNLIRGVRRISSVRQTEQGRLDDFGPSDGLSGGRVYAAFEDREGNVWIGTDGGLDRFTSNKVTAFSPGEGLNSDREIALTATRDGSVWIVNYTRDFVQRYLSGRFVTSKLAPYSPSDTTRILSLYGEGENTLWVGGNFKLARGVDGRFSYVHRADIASGANVEAIAKDAAGNLWISQTRWVSGPGEDRVGDILRLHDDTWTDLRSQFLLPRFRCRVIYADPRGGVWFGFENGEVAAYENNALHVYSASDGLPNTSVLTIAADRSGHIWVGGQGGLSRFKDGRFLTLTKKSGLPGDSVSAVVEDDNGFLWLAGSLGVLRVDPRELDAALGSPAHRIQGTFFGPNDGLRGLPRQQQPFPVACRGADGRLWFATTGGVAVIDPRHWSKNQELPPVVIEAVEADDRTYTDLAGLKLRPGTKNLEFRFTALSLTDPARVAFRYRLDGYDSDWHGPANAREAKYTNLPPRSYRFQVIASNNDGVWNLEGATVPFSILPTYYQTTWFRVLCVAAAGCLVMLAYRWRIRQLASRLDSQFEARLAERTRIAQDLHDTLLQGVISASMLLHVAHRNLSADSPARPLLARVLDLVRQITEDGRRAIQGLVLPGLDSDDLQSAFLRIASEFDIQKTADFRIEVLGPPRALHPVIRDEVYRIVREALTNVALHSQANIITIELLYAVERLRVLVRDNGCGMDEQVLRSGREGHLGLSGMRARATKIGARLRISSRVPGGTEVELSVPAHVAYRAYSHKGAA